jgi:hypothetical protein
MSSSREGAMCDAPLRCDAVSTNPKACNAVRACAREALGPITVKVHWASVGGFFVRTDIDHLKKTLSSILLFPHRHVGRTAFLKMAMMACPGELPIVGPIAADRSLPFKLKQEQS